MKQRLLILSVFIGLLHYECKMESNNASAEVPVRFTPEHFIIPLPEGIYVPKELRALNMKEMVMAKDRDNFKFDMTIKSFDGTVIGQDSIMKSIKPYFIQLYANDSGRIVEGVAFFITKDFQRDIIEWKKN